MMTAGIGSSYTNNTCEKGTGAEDASFIWDICIKSIGAKIADIVKYLGMYFQFFEILEVKLLYT